MIGDLWYKNAVVYCIDVRTFQDSNDDGIGDFGGLMRRLDYLAGLGVTCVWLLPFMRSPHRDDGYDISDYYAVDPAYGTNGDFVEFTHAARQRGIRVLIDLVINHTSDQHPWFQEARRSPDSRLRDWYVWSDKRPRDANKGMVFPGVQKSTWTYDAQARAWYFHRFYKFQPDLNTENPEVQKELRRVMGYWLELGVDGFRVDAVPFVISHKGPNVRPRQNFDMLRDLRGFLQWHQGDAVLLGEANVTPDQDHLYFGEADDRMHMMFNFQVNQHLFLALATGDARPLAQAIKATRAKGQTSQWASFLRNNDELDLGRLSESERQACFRAFGPEPRMQLYDRGIRRRLAPMLDNDRRKLELAYSLMFTLPGTPVLRYGDEMGMGDDLRLKERNCGRTPMQWADEPHAGFTRGERPVVPVIEGGPYGRERVNVAEQRRDPDSLLNWTERIIRMRKECPEIGWGEPRVLAVGDTAVLALRYDFAGEAVLVVHNLAPHPRSVRLRPGSPGALVDLLGRQHSRPDRRGVHLLELEPHGYRWFRLGGRPPDSD